MQTFWLCVMLAGGMYMDTYLFNQINLFGMRPDILLATVVSAGVLLGGAPAAIIGGGIGLLLDVFFGKMIGLNSAALVIAGMVGGMFYRKFYADNAIIPALCAAACGFLKEHIMAFGVLVSGGRFSYGSMLVGYILPSALMTSLTCVLVHMLLKRAGDPHKRRMERIAIKR